MTPQQKIENYYDFTREVNHIKMLKNDYLEEIFELKRNQRYIYHILQANGVKDKNFLKYKTLTKEQTKNAKRLMTMTIEALNKTYSYFEVIYKVAKNVYDFKDVLLDVMQTFEQCLDIQIVGNERSDCELISTLIRTCMQNVLEVHEYERQFDLKSLDKFVENLKVMDFELSGNILESLKIFLRNLFKVVNSKYFFVLKTSQLQ